MPAGDSLRRAQRRPTGLRVASGLLKVFVLHQGALHVPDGLRFAEDIMCHPERVLSTVRAAVEHRALVTGVHSVANSHRKTRADAR